MRTSLAVLGLIGALILPACAGSDAPAPEEPSRTQPARPDEASSSPSASPAPDQGPSSDAPVSEFDSALEEALTLEAHTEGALGFAFTDVRGILETLGEDPVAFADVPPREDWEEADRWTLGVVSQNLPAGPDGFSPLVPSNDIDWIYNGMSSLAIAAPPEQLEATRAIIEEAGAAEEFVFEDRAIVRHSQGSDWRPEIDDSLLASPVVQALLPCLEGAHLAAIMDAHEGLSVEHPFATAARVDEDVQGHAWACVYVADGAQEYADSLDPEQVGEVRVEGDVVRVEVVYEPNTGPIPVEAGYGHAAVRAMSPGF